MNQSRIILSVVFLKASQSRQLNPSRHIRFFSKNYSNDLCNGVTDYFHVLGIRRSYDMSKEELKCLYKEQMKVLHPDKHTMRSIEERNLVAEKTSEVTRGYQVLKSDYGRAIHVLELEGYSMEDNMSENILDSKFLMNIMEIRELIDDTNSQEKLQELLNRNEESILSLVQDLLKSFEAQNFDEAKRLTLTLQYLNRIKEAILEKVSSKD